MVRGVALLSGVALVFSTCAASAIVKRDDDDAALPPAGLAKASAKFGSFDVLGELTESARIPYEIGMEYGWRIDLREVPGKIIVEENFKLPAVADWILRDPNEEIVFAEGRHAKRIKILPADAKGDSRILSGSWLIAKGDPQGRHRIRLTVNGHRFTTLEFAIGETIEDRKANVDPAVVREKLLKAAADKDLMRWFQDRDAASKEWEKEHGVGIEEAIWVGGLVLGEMRKRDLLTRGMSRAEVQVILGKGKRRDEFLDYPVDGISSLSVGFAPNGKANSYHWGFDYSGGPSKDRKW